jgi:hypothetical protein
MSSSGIRQERIAVSEVIRQTMRGYAREPWLMLSASAAAVLATWLLHMPWLTGSPVGSVLAMILRLAVAVAFIGFVLIANNTPSDRPRGIAGVTLIARRANASAGELALLLLVMVIAIVILAGLLELVSLVLLLTLLLNTAKTHIGLLFDFPVRASVMTAPMLVLLTAWSVALPVAVVERPGSLLPLGRSYELVRGNRLRTFAVVMLLAVLTVLVSRGLGALVGAVEYEGMRLSGAIAALLLAPIPLLAMSALYRELRRASQSLPGG